MSNFSLSAANAACRHCDAYSPRPAIAKAQAVRWSTGTEPAKLKLPAGATDCHHHLYDPKYPFAPQATSKPADALASDYKLLMKRLGIQRHVLVQASVHGTDTSLLVDMLARVRQGGARRRRCQGRHHRRRAAAAARQVGVRGLRFMPQVAWLPNLEAMEALDKRVAPLGWCIQIQAAADYLVSIKDVLDRLQSPLDL